MTTFNVAGAGTYTLAASIGSTDASIILNSFTEPVTGTPYTMALLNTSIVYATIAPRTTSSEFISFTGITQNADGTATLTGVTRGLAKKYPFTTDTAYKLPHSGQSPFILSDAPQVFEKYVNVDNDFTINGLWTFIQTPIGLNPGAVQDASLTTKGIGKTSVAPLLSNNPIFVGDNDPRNQVTNFIPNTYGASSTGTDTYAITLPNAPSSYATGQIFAFKADVANTGACTLNVNGLGAKSLKIYGLDPRDNYIKVGSLVLCQYDGTNLQILSVSAQPQVSQDGAELYAITTGSANAYVAAITPTFAALVDGMVFRLKANFATTGSATLNINSIGAKTIKKYSDGALSNLTSNDILSAQDFTVIYQSSSDTFVMQSPAANSLGLPPYFPQRIGVNTGTGVFLFGQVTGVLTGVGGAADLYAIESSATSTLLIRKFKFDALTNALYDSGITGSVTIANGNQSYLTVLGSFVYVSYQNGGGTWKVDRFDLGTLANQITMTVSGTAAGNQNNPIWTDGTFLYINNAVTSAGQMKKYSVSGTTITFVTDITFTGIAATGNPPLWSDGVNVYEHTSTTTIKKWAIAGGAVVSTITSPAFSVLAGANFTMGVVGISGLTKMFVGVADYNFSNAPAVNGFATVLTPVSYL